LDLIGTFATQVGADAGRMRSASEESVWAWDMGEERLMQLSARGMDSEKRDYRRAARLQDRVND